MFIERSLSVARIRGSVLPHVILPALVLACLAASARPAYAVQAKPVPLSLKPMAFKPHETFTAMDPSLGRLTKDGVVEAYGFTITMAVEVVKGSESFVARVGEKKTARPRPPVFVELGEGAKKRAVCLVPWAGKEWLCLSAYGARFQLDGAAFYLVDANMNDVVGDGEGDAFAGPASRVLVPFCGKVWTERGPFELEMQAARSKSVSARAARVSPEVPETIDLPLAWSTLNVARQRVASGALSWDPVIAEHCRLHAAYCNLNGTLTHDEETGGAGYTAEGAKAGRESVGGQNFANYGESIVEQLRTAFHCADVLGPALKSSGFGLDGTFFFMNVRNFDPRHPALMNRPELLFIWPPHGAEDVFTDFNPSGEVPLPVPPELTRSDPPIGQVVFAQVAAKGDFSITLSDQRGRQVEGYLILPLPESVRSSYCMGRMFCFTPKSFLQGKTVYHAQLRETTGGIDRLAHAWEFRTR